jgi:Paraquat-inducible protein A
MKNNNTFSIAHFLMIGLIGGGIFLFLNILKLSDKRQEYENDKAILGGIKYGLFSVHEWKEKVQVVLYKKIDEFELNDENRGEINQKIEQMLYWALDEVEKILKARANESWIGIFQSLIASFALDIQDLRQRVPELASQALAQLGNDDTMMDLKKFLKSKLSDYLDKTVGKANNEVFMETLKKYDCPDRDAVTCIHTLEKTVKDLEHDVWLKSIYLILCTAGIFGIYFLANAKNKLSFYCMIASSSILLLAGILTPMIDLDARIKQIKFILMGEPIVFDEQMLFYQSKSIIDVFLVMIQNGQLESIFISVLILLFSVVFPLIKLGCSAAIVNNPDNERNGLVRFFVFKSSKWSMADVIVVAIFMSFIGFQGIINVQLAKLSALNDKVQVITTNETQLQAGFMVFTFFCLASILFSSILSKETTNSLVE